MPVHAMEKPLYASNTAAINGPSTLPTAEEDAVIPKNWPRHDGATKWLAIVFNMGKQRVADEKAQRLTKVIAQMPETQPDSSRDALKSNAAPRSTPTLPNRSVILPRILP